MVRLVRNVKGVFIVEVVVVLIPFLLMLFVLLEAFRREVFRVVMIHLACVEVRASALGDSKNDRLKQAQRFLDSVFGRSESEQLWKVSQIKEYRITNLDQLRWLSTPKLPGLLVETWIRYPQFLSFNFRRKRKHHEEMIQRCLFPFY